MASSKNSSYQPDVLTNATLRAGSALGLTSTQVSLVLGIEEEELENITIDSLSCTGLRAKQIIQIYEHLYALTGYNQTTMCHWMRTKNRQFSASPVEEIQTTAGLEKVLSYLESLRR